VHQIDVEQMNTTFSTPTSKMVKHKNKEDVWDVRQDKFHLSQIH
jgi:hypothetical protein